ncbi:hypothetical protein [Kutzneria buriramensis]|uniref:hypothetical protein n=1 Tax=Kutzneria buriramensis TaxID=1045776 RepID=UPI0014777DC0|nr:hypothetical protein [Kutzneria buriramensis]
MICYAAGSVLGPALLTSVVHAGRRKAVCRCEVSNMDDDGVEHTVAVTQGIIMSSGR